MTSIDRVVLDDLERRIDDELARMPVVDAHEHLRTEREFVDIPCDWAWIVQYVINDLKAAGLDDSFDIYDNALDPAEKWHRVRPFWRQARWGTPARILRLSLREWFNIDDVTDENFEWLGRKLNENPRRVYRIAEAP